MKKGPMVTINHDNGMRKTTKSYVNSLH